LWLSLDIEDGKIQTFSRDHHGPLQWEDPIAACIYLASVLAAASKPEPR
jgi:hypothetical protein